MSAESKPSATDPTVEVTTNGPYIVRGGPPMYRQQIVETELGEPIAWHKGERFESRASMALCRCGESANKPFCDGTHAKIGFVAEDVDTGLYADRAEPVGGTKISVYYDESICVHAGFCGNDTTSVWKLAKVADDDTNARIEMVGMIEHCPSGALTYTIEGSDTPNEPIGPTAIGIIGDGPIEVAGPVPVRLADETELEVRNRCTLCRCGHSETKPLCDGSHKEAGFVDH